MKNMLVVVLTALLTLIPAGCGQVVKEEIKFGDTDNFKTIARQAGFEVNEGILEEYKVIDMFNAGLVPSCYGNNPSTPYMVYKLPMPSAQKNRNLLSDSPINPKNKGLWVDLKFRQDEALVFIGNTPPEITYFSYRSYLAFRRRPDGSHFRIFASLGDTINNMTIKTLGNAQDPNGPLFDSPTVIITSASKATNEKVKALLEQAGFSNKIFNDDIVSSNQLRLGFDEKSDSLVFINRLAFFKDPKSHDEYMSKPQGRVLRLTPNQEIKPEPYPVEPTRVRPTGKTLELDLLPKLGKLREAILKKYSKYKSEDLKTSIWLLEAPDAIQREIDVLGETRDTSYLWTNPFILPNTPNDFVIAYGVNHEATGLASYCNVSAYGLEFLNGVDAVSNLDFAGTAQEYLPNDPDAKYFYVMKVARTNPDNNPTTAVVPWGKKAYGVELNKEVWIAFRAYLNKKTKVGPDWFEMLYDKAIKFSK